jgi:chromosome segregation ATPase
MKKSTPIDAQRDVQRAVCGRPTDLNQMIGNFNAAKPSDCSPRQSVTSPLSAFERTKRKKQSRQSLYHNVVFDNGGQFNNFGAFKEMDPALDCEGTHWPKSPTVARNRISELESIITKQLAELNLRGIQIAELCNVRQQQDSELLVACDKIDRLSKLIALFQDAVTRHETDAAAAKLKLIQSDKEKTALRAQLDTALTESTALLQRALSAETAFNDREIGIVAIQEKIEQIKASEKIRLATAIEDVSRQYHNELNQKSTHFKNQIRMIESIVAERNAQVVEIEEARAKLTYRYDDLAKIVDTLECKQQLTQNKIESQISTIEVLETILSVEREAAELKIGQLTAEFQRGCLEHAAVERASATMRKEIVLLLPKLAARQDETSRPVDTSVPATR